MPTPGAQTAPPCINREDFCRTPNRTTPMAHHPHAALLQGTMFAHGCSSRQQGWLPMLVMLSPQKPPTPLGFTQSSDLVWTPGSQPEPWAAAEEFLGSQSHFSVTPLQQLQEPVTKLNSPGNATSTGLGPCDPRGLHMVKELCKEQLSQFLQPHSLMPRVQNCISTFPISYLCQK